METAILKKSYRHEILMIIMFGVFAMVEMNDMSVYVIRDLVDESIPVGALWRTFGFYYAIGGLILSSMMLGKKVGMRPLSKAGASILIFAFAFMFMLESLSSFRHLYYEDLLPQTISDVLNDIDISSGFWTVYSVIAWISKVLFLLGMILLVARANMKKGFKAIAIIQAILPLFYYLLNVCFNLVVVDRLFEKFDFDVAQDILNYYYFSVSSISALVGACLFVSSFFASGVLGKRRRVEVATSSAAEDGEQA